MKAYQYDLAGVYCGATEADESPLEPGVYILPARCTTVAPPDEIPAGKAARWNGASWVLVNLPEKAEEPSPVEKLAAFLKENPDVASLIEG